MIQKEELDYQKEKTIGERSTNMVKKIKKVAKALKKASKLHAGQAKMLKGVLSGKKNKKSS